MLRANWRVGGPGGNRPLFSVVDRSPGYNAGKRRRTITVSWSALDVKLPKRKTAGVASVSFSRDGESKKEQWPTTCQQRKSGVKEEKEKARVRCKYKVKYVV